jgi:hypothetical protein
VLRIMDRGSSFKHPFDSQGYINENKF